MKKKIALILITAMLLGVNVTGCSREIDGDNGEERETRAAVTRDPNDRPIPILDEDEQVVISFNAAGLTDEMLATKISTGEIPSNTTHLSLRNNSLTDISPLAEFADLIELSLSGNQISVLPPLSGMESLASLNLLSNQITDISPLTELPSIMVLHLQNNQIDDISPLTEIDTLTVVNVFNNPIDNTQLEEVRATLTNTTISTG
ncbi:MAG: leucine-rich repeat domain-containing protein [Oscillospiraceae bacterium]|nr:leucine-rich repeat domain-containing protein [Oscillospiraceae bacterium]